MPEGMMYVRFVHLLDEQKRKELTIIYGENLGPSGFTADLQKKGKVYDRWPAFEQGLLARAEKSVTIDSIKP
jgi:hypothetical protein